MLHRRHATRWVPLTLALAVSSLTVGAALAVDSVGPAYLPAGTFEATPAPASLRLAEGMSPDARSSLPSAEVGAVDQLAAMRAWNRAGKVPAKAGFHRILVEPLRAHLAPTLWTEAVGRPAGGGWVAISPRGNLVWGTSIEVAGASRLRVELANVDLPEGTRLWVYALGEESRPFDLEYLGADRTLWSPSVLGDRLNLEVEIPESARAGTWGFEIRQVSQIFDARGTARFLSFEASPEDCLEFGSCFDATDFAGYEAARHGVFNYVFEEGGSSYTCSAALLNDFDPATQILWALTANHCISSTVADNSVEPLYNYYFNGCPWTSVNGDDGPVGATIKVTKAIPEPDVTLMQMNSSGIGFPLTLLGFTNAAVPTGTDLFRLSHPVAAIPDSGDPTEYILPQMYSEHTDTHTPDFLCEDGDPMIEPGEVTLVNFIYSVTTLGTTAGGSSGSPVMLNNGQVVGQLLGKCSAGGTDDCAYDEFNVLDGRLQKSYGFLDPFLNPGMGGGCTPSPTTACLGPGGRFKVEGFAFDFETPPTQHDMTLAQVNGADNSSDDSAVFWFFGANNWEMLVKVLDACSFNNHFWVFFAATTNVEFHLTVTDTQAAIAKTYDSPAGPPAPAITDTAAFATCP